VGNVTLGVTGFLAEIALVAIDRVWETVVREREAILASLGVIERCMVERTDKDITQSEIDDAAGL
jgi:hypothetical protein